MARLPSFIKPSGASDAALLEAVARGDLAGLGQLYERHAESVLRFARRARGESDAEDVVQATFERAVKTAERYDGRSDSARSWLLGIAARILQERRRSAWRLSRLLAAVSWQRTPVCSPSHAEGDIRRGLERLSDAKRVVVVLVEIEGFRGEDVAQMLDIPVGTVWTRLHHARRELRQFCEDGR